MKKRAKAKTSKSSAKHSAPAESELPSLVMAMTKLVERLETLERKTDQVLGRVSNFPSELRNALQNLQRPNPPQTMQAPQRAEHGPSHGQPPARSERTMYKAICADCRKSCEVPFKPTEERPVYCKECFAARKANQFSQGQPNRPAGLHPQHKAGHLSGVLTPSRHGVPRPTGLTIVHKSKPAQGKAAKPKKKKK